jgi:hypothetical protein
MRPDGASQVYEAGGAVGTLQTADGLPVWVVRDPAGTITIRKGEALKTASAELKAREPCRRPNGATTPAQRASVQGKPCAKCGTTTDRQFAGHKRALVREQYQTGKIDTERTRSPDSVHPECPACSHKEGAEMSRYSKEIRKALRND